MEPEKKSNGASAGLIVIIIILIIGGIYMWQSSKDTLMEETQISEQDSVELNTLEQDLEKADTSIDVDAETVY